MIKKFTLEKIFDKKKEELAKKGVPRNEREKQAKKEMEKDIKIAIGNRLFLIREKLGITQSVMLEKLHPCEPCSVQRYSDIENGKLFPSCQMLIRLVEVFDLDLCWLLTGKENKQSQYSTKEDVQDINYMLTIAERIRKRQNTYN